jgi:hypothetical protein
VTDLMEDPVLNVVNLGIKEPIRLLLENHHFAAALILTFAGIDAVAHLASAAGKTKERRKNFIAWCESYLVLPGKHQLTGLELYAARCGLLHTHSGASDLSQEGRARVLHYADALEPPVKYVPSVDPNLVAVSIQALVESFFTGVERCMVDIYKDPERAHLADRRFANLLHCFPYVPEPKPVA